MSTSCSSDPSYFATAEFLKLSLHCLSAIELPIHGFGAWCILCKTPPKMSTVKWSLLSLHLSLAIADLTTSALCVPFLVLPAMGGFPLGLLTEWAVPTDVQVYLNLTLIGCAGCSVFGLFESRYTSLMGGLIWRKYGRYAFQFVNYTVAVTFLIPQFIWFVPDQQQALLEARKFLPCDMDHPETVFLLGGSTWYFVTVTFALCAYLTIAVWWFSISMQKYLGKMAVISKQTNQLQIRLQYAMIIQIVIPTIVFLIPVLMITGSLRIEYHNQSLNNVAMFLLCTHSLSSTVAMLLIHQPYRSALISLIPIHGRDQRARTERSSVGKIQ